MSDKRTFIEDTPLIIDTKRSRKYTVSFDGGKQWKEMFLSKDEFRDVLHKGAILKVGEVSHPA